jgi:hypothetical protein
VKKCNTRRLASNYTAALLRNKIHYMEMRKGRPAPVHATRLTDSQILVHFGRHGFIVKGNAFLKETQILNLQKHNCNAELCQIIPFLK